MKIYKIDGSEIYSCEAANIKEALMLAIKDKADLSGADLSGADLSGANIPSFSHVPQEGSFIAFKKLSSGIIAKLEIPEGSKRTSSLIGRKNRAEFVKVISLSDGSSESVSNFELIYTLYKVGEIVYPDKYDDDIRVECSNGIHFFITEDEARKY